MLDIVTTAPSELDPSVEAYIARIERDRYSGAPASCTGFSVFANPLFASTHGPTSSLKIHYGTNDSVIFFMDDAGLAADLADAVNAVFARHAVPPKAAAEADAPVPANDTVDF